MMTFTVTMNNYQMEQFMQYLKGAKKAKAETEE